jgi:AraC-like DNA-binding protein
MAVRALVAGVERAGVRRERFMADAGLVANQLEDGLKRIPLSQYQHVVQAALASSGDPALGLHMGEDPTRTGFDVLGPLIQSSLDLREALLKCVRYATIATDGRHVELHERGDEALIVLPSLRGDSPETMFMAEFASSGLWFQLIRRFVGATARLQRACFAFEAPAHRCEYTRIFQGSEHFAQAFTGLTFERSWLDRKQLEHSAELSALLQSRADMLLARIDRAAPTTERVMSWLTAQDLKSKPAMDALAQQLGMSARSLRRRLQAEGSEYSVLLERARAEAAKRLLSTPFHSVQEAAYELGFATPGAFARAFKRWTGQSPSAFRARH